MPKRNERRSLLRSLRACSGGWRDKSPSISFHHFDGDQSAIVNADTNFEGHGLKNIPCVLWDFSSVENDGK